MKRDVNLSRTLSYVLRHKPDSVGLTLDAAGWASVTDLLMALARKGHTISRATLERVVRDSDKQRFALSEDGLRIRANQGHSLQVDLGYEPAVPPRVLYHGTVERALASIRAQGLARRQRHHVHLSATVETASVVGARRGRPVVLSIDAKAMHEAGHAFFCSTNSVWLTEHVPPVYIRFPEA